MFNIRIISFLLPLLLCHGIHADLTINIPPGSSLPPSNPVSPDFVGLSVELSSSALIFGGPGSNLNPYFLMYIKNMKSRTGTAPIIRIGGNSADTTTFSASQLSPVQPGSNSKRSVIASPSLPATMASISSQTDVHWVLGLNFADPTNTTSALELSSSAIQAVGDNLIAFEIGNEPDIYPGEYRPKSYNISTYVQEWTNFSASLNTQLQSQNILPSRPLYQVAVFSGRWTIDQLVATEFLNSSSPLITSVSMHRYDENGCSSHANPTAQYLLQHQNTVKLVSSLATGIRSTLAANKRYVVGETNSISCGGSGGSDTFFAALWGIDWALQLAANNVSGMNFHTGSQTIYSPFSFNPWEPKPLYYALIVAAEAIAPVNSLSPIISEVVTSDSNTVVYVVYQPQSSNSTSTSQLLPTRIVVLDLNSVSKTLPAPRLITFTFSSLPASQNLSANPIAIKRLSAPNSYETDNILWAGQSFKNTSDGSLGGNIMLERPYSSTENSLQFQLYQSSALIIEFGVTPNSAPFTPPSSFYSSSWSLTRNDLASWTILIVGFCTTLVIYL